MSEHDQEIDRRMKVGKACRKARRENHVKWMVGMVEVVWK